GVLKLKGRGAQAGGRLRPGGGRGGGGGPGRRPGRGSPGGGAGAAARRGAGTAGAGAGPQRPAGAGDPKLTVIRLNPRELSIPVSMPRVLRSASAVSGLGRAAAAVLVCAAARACRGLVRAPPTGATDRL